MAQRPDTTEQKQVHSFTDDELAQRDAQRDRERDEILARGIAIGEARAATVPPPEAPLQTIDRAERESASRIKAVIFVFYEVTADTQRCVGKGDWTRNAWRMTSPAETPPWAATIASLVYSPEALARIDEQTYGGLSPADRESVRAAERNDFAWLQAHGVSPDRPAALVRGLSNKYKQLKYEAGWMAIGKHNGKPLAEIRRFYSYCIPLEIDAVPPEWHFAHLPPPDGTVLFPELPTPDGAR